MVVFSFRTLGYVWAGLAATAALSAAALESSYETPAAIVAAVPAPAPAPAEPLPLFTPPPPPAHPAARRQASLPLPPVPPRMHTARSDRHAPPETYRWGATAYPGQYAMIRSWYPQPGYYGWQPAY